MAACRYFKIASNLPDIIHYLNFCCEPIRQALVTFLSGTGLSAIVLALILFLNIIFRELRAICLYPWQSLKKKFTCCITLLGSKEKCILLYDAILRSQRLDHKSLLVSSVKRIFNLLKILHLHKLVVKSIFRHQFGMSALLHYISILQHNNFVSILNG